MTVPPSPTLPAPPPDPQRTAEARSAFTAHLTSIGNTHIHALETRVADIHSNSLAISKQEKEIEKNRRKLGEEGKRHQKVADGAGKQLKELGDIQNWAEVLERDLLVLEETVRLGEGEDGWITDEEEGEGEGDAAGGGKADKKGVEKENGKGMVDEVENREAAAGV